MGNVQLLRLIDGYLREHLSRITYQPCSTREADREFISRELPQAAWFVRNEVKQAKEEGLLPDDFVAQEMGGVSLGLGGHLEQLDVVNRSGIWHHCL